jgi:hypothetical protein
MARATFTKRDKNRYRKVYPFIRRTPRNELLASRDVRIEIAEMSYAASDSGSKTYEFKESFPDTNTLTVVVSSKSATSNASLVITELLNTQVTIQASTGASFTDTVEIQAIYIPD